MSETLYKEVHDLLADEEFNPLRRNAACHQCRKHKAKCDGVCIFSGSRCEDVLTRFRQGQHVLHVCEHMFVRSKAPSDIILRFRRRFAPILGQVTEGRRRTIGKPGEFIPETGSLSPEVLQVVLLRIHSLPCRAPGIPCLPMVSKDMTERV
jgi:hypothetical protein